MKTTNIDRRTVESFGHEWSTYTQTQISKKESESLFQRYFSIFPWQAISENAIGFDMGCGTGRWARHVAPRVRHLTCIDPSPQALKVAQKNLTGISNVSFQNRAVFDTDLPLDSQDFGYSLGVLHHVPDTEAGLRNCVSLLKPGAPFLLYLYYRFDNRPVWFRLLWYFSDVLRHMISRFPKSLKNFATDALALVLYWPLARLSLWAERIGLDVKNMPLYAYRHLSFYTMRTDSRDRFGTPLERRFTQDEIFQMMSAAGLQNIVFSNSEPYWCAVGFKNKCE